MFDGRYHIANCGHVFCLTTYNHANLIAEYWRLLDPFKWFRGALSDARWKNAKTTSVGSQSAATSKLFVSLPMTAASVD